jgi:peptidyl-prolyl cis-trans isomerase C
MKCSVSILPLAFCAVSAWGQSTSNAPKAPAPAATPGTPSSAPATPGLQPRGPEAVAKQQPDKVVATINGKPITAKQADDLLNSLPPQSRSGYQGNLSNLLQQVYTENEIAALALKDNLDQKSPWKLQIQWSRDNILAQAYLRNLMESPAEAEKAKQYYDAHPADFDQLKISGIMVAFNAPGTPAGSSAAVTRTEADAQAKAADLESKLKGGGDFSALAKTDSDLQQSASKGGDMGTFVMADTGIPADIKNAVAKLQAGQVSQPVRVTGVGGMNGFLIIKVDNRTRTSFDQVKSGIIQKLALEKYAIHVEDPDFFSGSHAAPVPSLARPNAPAASTTSSPATPVKPPSK